jgi:uncharacterized protein (TIGR02246 family)
VIPLSKASILSAIVLLACSCAPHAKAPDRKVDVNAELRRATQHYAELVRKMDHSGIADLFTNDGVLKTSGQKPVQGRQEIEKYLSSFSQYQVQSESMMVKTVNGNSSSGHVTGEYVQTVRVPAGSVVQAQGSFSADWVRGEDDVWRLRRLAAFPGGRTAAAAD